MKQLVFEIVRQKWRLLSIITFMLLLNVLLSVVISAYQIPAVVSLQSKWSDLRQKAALFGKVDAGTLYKQGAADLEKLKTMIPEKREFARILSDLWHHHAICRRVHRSRLFSFQFHLHCHRHHDPRFLVGHKIRQNIDTPIS